MKYKLLLLLDVCVCVTYFTDVAVDVADNDYKLTCFERADAGSAPGARGSRRSLHRRFLRQR